MKRRRFLTQTAHVLAAIGLSDLVLGDGEARRVGQRWQAIAANEGRRMALLLGIDHYDHYSTPGQALNNLVGCKQDTELQRQLLQFGFGFPANNITTVIDEAATSDRLDAELQRLAMLLKPQDSLVIHFSGYGTQLTGEVDPATPDVIPRQRAIVLADAIALPLAELSDRLRSLPTRNIIVTIDASYAPPTSVYRQELRSRVISESIVMRSGLIPSSSSSSTTQTQTQLSQANSQTSKKQRDPASRPMIITYGSSGLSTERRWSDFDAGVLTYVLTQSLWHLGSTSNWSAALATTVERIERSLGSPPLLQARNGHEIEPWSGSVIEAGIVPTTPTSTIGAIVSQTSDRPGDLELWLGGLPPTVLSHYAAGSIVTLDRDAIALPSSQLPPLPKSAPPSEAQSEPQSEPQSTNNPAIPAEPITSVDATLDPMVTPVGDRQDPANRSLWLRIADDRGLRRTAHPFQAMTENLVDRPIFEVVRVIPRSIQLGVALETHLSRIERVDATSALSGLRGIEAIASADREADCWFGCSLNCDGDGLSQLGSGNSGNSGNSILGAANNSAELSAKLEASSPKRYTLLAFDRQPIFDCPFEPDEAIKRTIRRLQPRLQDLRAFKILATTENATASMLKVRVTYGLAQTDPTVPDRGLRRTRQTAAISTPAANTRDTSTLELPSGSQVLYRIENLSDRPLFCILVRLDACGRLTIPDTNERVVRSRDVLTLPERPEATAWNIERDPGLVRLFAILSDRPFQQTQDSLTRNHATGSRDLARETEARDLSGEVVEAIVADLDRASRDQLPDLDFSADTYALDVRRWATLPLIYRITDPENS